MSRSIVLVSLSAIADDPRVRRQGDLLHAHGWDVCGVGLAGARSAPPAWQVIEARAGDGTPVRGAVHAAVAGPLDSAGLLQVARGVVHGLRRAAGASRRLALAQASRVAPRLALATHGRRPDVVALAAAARETVGRHALANDWTALPVAAQLARERGGRFGYDTHEFATQEYAHRRSWRWLHRPVAHAVEARFVREAAWVSTVSEGIAEAMERLYRLPRRPTVLRNLPRYQPTPYRAPGEVLEVLYHGILAPNRGLEASIQSVGAWKPDRRLSLRGPGEPAYVSSLRGLVERRGLNARVAILPPVAATELVSSAAAFDVGLFALPPSSPQNVYALPNKIFEYVMAGLAVCVTDLPEMAAVVRRHDLGRIVPSATPEAIAAGINALDREAVAGYKQRALVAARQLCWEVEGERLLQLCDAMVAAA